MKKEFNGLRMAIVFNVVNLDTKVYFNKYSWRRFLIDVIDEKRSLVFVKKAVAISYSLGQR